MFHMTNDSGLFRTRQELEEQEGAWPLGGNRFRSAAGDWVPLYEGMVHDSTNITLPQRRQASQNRLRKAQAAHFGPRASGRAGDHRGPRCRTQHSAVRLPPEQALSGTILVRRSRALSAIDRHDLARIGSNLNQIARACNTTGDTFRARNIEATLDELRSLLRRTDGPRQASDELREG